MCLCGTPNLVNTGHLTKLWRGLDWNGMGILKMRSDLRTGSSICTFIISLYVVTFADVETRMTTAFVDFNGVVPEKVGSGSCFMFILIYPNSLNSSMR